MVILSFLISVVIPLMLLNNRKKKWYNWKLKLFLILGLSLLGGSGFAFYPNNESRLFFYALLTIPSFVIFDAVCKYLSLKIHGRDFYLWSRGSREMDDALFAENPHIKATDIIFSFFLQILIVAMAVFGVFLFGNFG